MIAALWGWLAGLIDGIEVGYSHLVSLLRGKSGRRPPLIGSRISCFERAPIALPVRSAALSSFAFSAVGTWLSSPQGKSTIQPPIPCSAPIVKLLDHLFRVCVIAVLSSSAHNPNGPDGLTLEERGTAIRNALATLPSKQKKVLELAYFQGLLMTEIAESMSESLGNVRNQYYRGLKKLQQSLGEFSR